MSKYTKGPWRTERNPSNPAQWMVIASTHETVVHQVAGGKEHAEPNAKLLAAAPDMAEVLIEIRHHLYEKQDWARARDMAAEILEKAGVTA